MTCSGRDQVRPPILDGGDGKSALGPVLREYLVSEAMTALGVPSTRSLAALATGETVQRETRLPGGILLRVAASHIRIGTFQYFYAREDREGLQKLADYTLQRHYPLAQDQTNPYLALLENVLRAQARLIAQWMHLGFIHGVMNTDNVTLSGETIDYGPCAFMDTFHPQCVFSYIDQQARYAWGNQPSICHWNLTRLAESLLPLLHPDKTKAIALAEEALDKFPSEFETHYNQGFCRKLGIEKPSNRSEDIPFIQKTLQLLAEHQIDYTLFFRHLTSHAHGASPDSLLTLFKDPEAITKWLEQWREQPHTPQTRSGMKTANPVRIPRNHQIEKVIQSAYQNDDFKPFHRLHEALNTPFEDQSQFQEFEAAPLPHEAVAHTFCGT